MQHPQSSTRARPTRRTAGLASSIEAGEQPTTRSIQEHDGKGQVGGSKAYHAAEEGKAQSDGEVVLQGLEAAVALLHWRLALILGAGYLILQNSDAASLAPPRKGILQSSFSVRFLHIECLPLIAESPCKLPMHMISHRIVAPFRVFTLQKPAFVFSFATPVLPCSANGGTSATLNAASRSSVVVKPGCTVSQTFFFGLS